MAWFGHRRRHGRRRRGRRRRPAATRPPTSSSSPTRRRPATRWPWPPSPAARVQVRGLRRGRAAGRRPLRRPARPRWAARSSAPPTGVARRPVPPTARCTGIDVDMADISDLVPDAGRGRAVRVDAHPHPRRRVHPRQGERPSRRPGRASCARLGADVDETDDGLLRRPVRGRRCTAAGSAPTTTTVWRWRSACSARSSPGIEVERPRRGLEELARASGRCSTACDDATGTCAARGRSVAAFDFDGTVTEPRLRRAVPAARRPAGHAPRSALAARRRTGCVPGARPARPRRAEGRRHRGRVHRSATPARRAALAHEYAARDRRRRPARRHGRPPPLAPRRGAPRRDRVGVVRAVPAVVADHLGVARRGRHPARGRRRRPPAPGGSHGLNCRAGREGRRGSTPGWPSTGWPRRTSTLWAYGDSAGDRELLAVADHPVWVDGPARLAVAPTP